MGIQFNEEGMPSKKALLDQAAGVGLEFVEDSLEELHFLDFCRTLWLHGNLGGIRAMSGALQKRLESETESN